MIWFKIVFLTGIFLKFNCKSETSVLSPVMTLCTSRPKSFKEATCAFILLSTPDFGTDCAKKITFNFKSPHITGKNILFFNHCKRFGHVDAMDNILKKYYWFLIMPENSLRYCSEMIFQSKFFTACFLAFSACSGCPRNK